MTSTKNPTTDALREVLPRMAELREIASGYGLAATKAESALLSPAETYIRTVLAGMKDPEMTVVAGNIRNFWALVMEASWDD